jgi:hypothetical protein
LLQVGTGDRPAVRSSPLVPQHAQTDGHKRLQGSTTVPGRSALGWPFGTGTGIDPRPDSAFQARDPGPCWVRTTPESAGPRRARAVTLGESESQVIGPYPAPPGTAKPQVLFAGRATSVPFTAVPSGQPRTTPKRPRPAPFPAFAGNQPARSGLQAGGQGLHRPCPGPADRSGPGRRCVGSDQ